MADMSVGSEPKPTPLPATTAQLTIAPEGKRNIWQVRQEQHRIARETADRRARERQRERQDGAFPNEHEERTHAWGNRPKPPQHASPGSYMARLPVRHDHPQGNGSVAAWSHSDERKKANNQQVARYNNTACLVEDQTAVDKPLAANNVPFRCGRDPAERSLKVPASGTLPSNLKHTVTRCEDSKTIHSPSAQYHILRERNRQEDAGFTGQLHIYVLQVLLPPVLFQESQRSLMEEGRRQIEAIAQSVCPRADLVPFGSVVNGLALRNSDLDLCLVLGENAHAPPADEEQTPRMILERLGKSIRREIPYLYCQYRTNARIPVIKLYARRQLDGGLGARWNSFNADVSVGNLLAIWNTRLLEAYCCIDERFKYLVLFLKIWSSRRKINEAFHGTLSSYGWSLMAVHLCMYALEPPLLPNLQNIERPSETREEDMVGGANTYFFNDLARLQEHFTTLNPTSLGTLIVDFFAYYSSKFDLANDVISLRQQKLTKADKGWDQDLDRNHNFICIEDPFKTDYNVGRVVQSTGFQLIQSEIIRASKILSHATETRQYIGSMINHLLEPGEGVAKKPLRIPKEGATVRQEHTHQKPGRSAPLPPGSGMLAALPVLKSVIRADDFPALGSASTRAAP